MTDATRGPNPIDVHVGAQVAMYRKLAGISQEALGDAIGVTFQQVQKYERGTNRIGASRLFAIGQALDVPVSVFFRDLDVERELHERGAMALAATSREGIELLRAFTTIPDPTVRDHILGLVRRLAHLGTDERGRT